MDTVYTRVVPALRSPAPRRTGAFAAWLQACLERSRQRRDLGLLSDEQLEDIGLSRGDAARECGRWPWDGPEPRRARPVTAPPIRPRCAR
ncbi:MAG TPA: DUF1127 domain-containing protein [Beijerinckiaceae bacterium]|jgi:uncharacterized protein YjiS (DUF1127 family)